MPKPDEVITDWYHGTPVEDPYRWLEGDDINVQNWIADQTRSANAYFSTSRLSELMSQIEPQVQRQLTRKLVMGPIIVRKNNYFFMRRQHSEQQASIVCRHGYICTEEVLVNPAERDIHGSVSVELIDVSANSKWLAYGVRVGGSHHQAVEILDLETRSLHPWSLPPGYLRSFAFEEEYTARYIHEDPSAARPYLRQEVRQHLLDDDLYKKINYIAGESRNLRFVSYYSKDFMLGIYRMIRLENPQRETIMFLNRWDCGSPMALVADGAEFSGQFQVLPRSVYACTTHNAPNKRICQLDLTCPTLDTARTVIPERSESIQWWRIVGDRMFVTYVRDLVNVTEIFDLNGQPAGSVQYPGGGTADLIGQDDISGEMFVTYESYNTPPIVLRISVDGVCSSFEPADNFSAIRSTTLDVRHCTAIASDGMKIPYTLLGQATAFSKNLVPTVLTGYGGNGVALTPRFSQFVQVWTNLGGIFAIANLRGGTEFGAKWHEAAKGSLRKVAFQDFRSIAEDLFMHQVTTPEQLGIAGGSNSGLLVAHAMTEWPERMRAVLCLAPITDLLRFNLQKPQYADELGSIENANDFQYLLSNSPFHRATNPKPFPALLMVSGAKDDTCAPYHALKFIAAAQRSNLSQNPILLDFDPMRGHVARLPLQTRIASLVRRLAFMAHELVLFPHLMKGGENYDVYKANS